jgi:hypothetical protein
MNQLGVVHAIRIINKIEAAYNGVLMKLFNLFALLLSLNINVGFARSITCADADKEANKLSRKAYAIYEKGYFYKYTSKTNTEACLETERKMDIWKEAESTASDARALWLMIAVNCPNNEAMATLNAEEEFNLGKEIVLAWSKTAEVQKKVCAKAKAYAEGLNQ